MELRVTCRLRSKLFAPLPQTIPVIPFPPLTGLYQWLPYFWMVWTAIGLIWYFIVRSQSPHITQQVGRRFETEEMHKAAKLS